MLKVSVLRLSLCFSFCPQILRKSQSPGLRTSWVCFSGCEDQRKVGPKSKERGDKGGIPVWEKPYWVLEEAIGIKGSGGALLTTLLSLGAKLRMRKTGSKANR